MADYKIGDKVLIEATVKDFISPNRLTVSICGNFYDFKTEQLRPHTPCQEFEYGEEVEASDGDRWFRALYIGKDHRDATSPYLVNRLGKDGFIGFAEDSKFCRKLNTKPRDTITIGNATYDKAEFENAVKDLKPVEGK